MQTPFFYFNSFNIKIFKFNFRLSSQQIVLRHSTSCIISNAKNKNFPNSNYNSNLKNLNKEKLSFESKTY